MNLAPRIKCKTLICNCLWDDICPPSTIFAAYNHMTAPKQIEIYPFHKHEIPYEHYGDAVSGVDGDVETVSR